MYIYTCTDTYHTSSTAQGGGGSFKNRKPIGEIDCCESPMTEQKHWWIELFKEGNDGCGCNEMSSPLMQSEKTYKEGNDGGGCNEMSSPLMQSEKTYKEGNDGGGCNEMSMMVAESVSQSLR